MKATTKADPKIFLTAFEQLFEVMTGRESAEGYSGDHSAFCCDLLDELVQSRDECPYSVTSKAPEVELFRELYQADANKQEYCGLGWWWYSGECRYTRRHHDYEGRFFGLLFAAEFAKDLRRERKSVAKKPARINT